MRVVSTVVFVVVLLSTCLLVRAQEITYDTTGAKYKLGAELWNIPISGVPTMSEDGSRVLIASRNDSSFYVVDVATGEYRKLIGVPFFPTSKYQVDPAFKRLYSLRYYGPAAERKYEHLLYDLEHDRMIYQRDSKLDQNGNGYAWPLAISEKYDLIQSEAKLYRLSDYTFVKNLDSIKFNGDSWFDDDHGVIYSVTNRTVSEYNISTGAVRSWGVANAKEAGEARRPKGQPWLYVATMNDRYDQFQPTSGDNMVYAINTETNERIEFTKYMGANTSRQTVRMTNEKVGKIWSSISGVHVTGTQERTKMYIRPIWNISASPRTTQYDLMLNADYTAKHLCLTPNSDKLIHTHNSDGLFNGVICNAVVANNTSIGEPPAVAPRWFLQQGTSIRILQQQIPFRSVSITSTDGRVVLQQPIMPNQGEIVLSTAQFAAGAYVCSVRSEQQVFSQTFTIVR